MRSLPSAFSGQHLRDFPGGGHVAFIAGVSRETLVQELAAPEKNRTVFVLAIITRRRCWASSLEVLSDRGDDRSSRGEIYLAGVRMFRHAHAQV